MKKGIETFVAGAGKKDDAFTAPVEKKTEQQDLDEAIAAYRAEGQKFLDSHANLLKTFAGDTSLRFTLSDAFKINLETGEVHLATEWFHEQGYTHDQILWACLHELSHFLDLAEDTAGVKKTKERVVKKGAEFGAEIAKRYEEKLGKPPSDVTRKGFEQGGQQVYHSFYNIFDDISVNHRVGRRAPTYSEEGTGSSEVKRLYQEKLFPEKEYAKLPRHLQFEYALLREEMVKDEAPELSPEVEEILDTKIKFQGKEYTPREIAANFLRHRTGRDTKVKTRHVAIRYTLEPIFDRLVHEDLAEWEPKEPPPPPEGGEGAGEGGKESAPAQGEMPWDKEYREQKNRSIDQITEEEIDKWQTKHEEEKKKEEQENAKEEAMRKKSTQEKADEEQNRLNKEWQESQGVSNAEMAAYSDVERKIAPFLDDLSDLWRHIVYGSTRAIRRGMEGHFREGTELDIQEVIKKWAEIVTNGPDNVRVMNKMTSHEELIQRPELIRVRLVGDGSGSMDNEKRRVLEQCYVLLTSSLDQFNRYLNLTRKKTKSKLRVETEGWVFGNRAEKIQGGTGNLRGKDDRADAIKAFTKLGGDHGATYDHLAFEEIEKSLTDEDKEALKKEKLLDIVIEITDGGSSSEQATKESVERLGDAGLVVRAFQIGTPSHTDAKIFERIWMEDKKKPTGIFIGTKLEVLVPALAELLKSYLGRVQL